MIKAAREHEFEPEFGLPEPLPADETLLWQGAPKWQQLALHAFHVDKVAIYFLLLLAVGLTNLIRQQASTQELLASVGQSLLVATITLSLLAALAWFSSKTSAYSITDKRVVMRIGMVLTVTFNLPYQRIEAASLKKFRGGAGDIALRLAGSDRIGWLHLWPHARAWHLSRPEPTLRCVANAAEVGHILLRAWDQERNRQPSASNASQLFADEPIQPERVSASA